MSFRLRGTPTDGIKGCVLERVLEISFLGTYSGQGLFSHGLSSVPMLDLGRRQFAAKFGLVR